MTPPTPSAETVVAALPARYNAADDLLSRHLAAGRGAKVAYIDDTGPTTFDELDAHCRGFAGALRQAGFTVLEAATGAEALRLTAEHKPALVLLDVNMPDMSGLEVCRRLKSDPDTAAILVLHVSATATSARESSARDSASGLRAFCKVFRR